MLAHLSCRITFPGTNVPRLVLLIAALLLSSPALGRETAPRYTDISVDEKLGQVVPSGIRFRDESGSPVELASLLDKPLIVAPVYFHCAHVCPQLLNGLASALGKMDLLQPGRDYRVAALSFDETEPPDLAREKKPNYLAAIGRPFPPEAWRFLTGDSANILAFTGAVGYRFQKDGQDFSHPLALIVLAPGGKVVRYLYGTTFLPFDVTMALTEAAAGRTGTTAGRVLTYCFSYDPQKQSYVFNVLRIVGTVMILTVFSFFIYLVVTTKRQRMPDGQDRPGR
jgi:protein SCO1